jgi:hypothetical protein
VPRLVAAALLVALLPVSREVDAGVAVGVVAAAVWTVLVFESVRHAEARHLVRHGDAPGDHAS